MPTLVFDGQTAEWYTKAEVDALVGLQAPAQAAAAGFTSLAFIEDFDDTSGIDMADTRQAGFNFYRATPFGFPQTPTSQILVSSNSILTVTSPADTAGYAIGTTCGIGNNQWIGFDAVGGAYFEARLAVDPDVQGADGWPAFWSMASEHLWASSTANDFMEMDFFEKLPLGSPTFYSSNTHDWDYPGPTVENSANNFIEPGGAFNFEEFHSYGTLWVPGSHIAHYRDNVLIFTETYASNPWMADGDDNGYPIILGGDEWPLMVDWVRVWQAP